MSVRHRAKPNIEKLHTKNVDLMTSLEAEARQSNMKLSNVEAETTKKMETEGSKVELSCNFLKFLS